MTTNTLTERQSNACNLINQGMSFDQVAQEVGVTVRTLRNWRGLPEWKANSNALREIAMEATQDRLRRLAGKAVDALETLLASDDEGIKLKAVERVLTVCPPFPDPSGASIGSTLPNDFQRNILGVTVGDAQQEQTQSVLHILEGFLTNEYTTDEVSALLGVDTLTVEMAQSLIADGELLRTFVIENMD